MVEITVKMKTGENLTTRLEGTRDDAKKFLSQPFVEFQYENGFVLANMSDASLISVADVAEDQPQVEG